MWNLIPDGSVSLSTTGNTLILAHSTDSEPASLIEELRHGFSSLPIDTIAALEIGPRCKASDDNAEGGEASEWSGDYEEISLEQWVFRHHPPFAAERFAFGPKAILIVTNGRPPEDLRCVSHLTRAFSAQRNWHGPTTLLLSFHGKDGVSQVWRHPAVQRTLTDPSVDYLACFEIGPGEAASDPLVEVLLRCPRGPAVPGRPRAIEGPVRTVVVERVRRRETKQGVDRAEVNRAASIPGGGNPPGVSRYMGPRKGDPKSLPADNDHALGVNDNQFRTTIEVPARPIRKRRSPHPRG